MYNQWEPDSYEPDCYCNKCEEHEQKMDQVKDFVEGVIEQLYSTEKLDVSILEHCLDELCFLVEAKMNKGFLQVERKGLKAAHRMDGALDAWKLFNNQHLQQQAV